MKLSEMTSKKAITTIRNLTPFLTKIVKNDKVKELMKKTDLKELQGEERELKAFETGVDRLENILYLLVDECTEELYNIIAIMNDKTVAEVEEMNFIDFISLSLESFMDKKLIELFTRHLR